MKTFFPLGAINEHLNADIEPALKVYWLEETFKDFLVYNMWPYRTCSIEMLIKPFKQNLQVPLASRRQICKSYSQAQFTCWAFKLEKKHLKWKLKPNVWDLNFYTNHKAQDSWTEINMKLGPHWWNTKSSSTGKCNKLIFQESPTDIQTLKISSQQNITTHMKK